MAALCWQQKCFKWAILNKEFNRKKIFHHLQIQDWAVGPQDPHRWLTWNMRTRCWVQVLEPGLCSPPSPTPNRPSSEISTLLFSLCFSIFHYFELFFPCFSLFFTFLNCFLLVFLYFLFFSLPQQRVRLFHVNHRRGRVVLSRFWHSLTWNRSTIWAPKQLPLCHPMPRSGLIAFFWTCFETSDPGGCPLLTAKILQMSNFK